MIERVHISEDFMRMGHWVAIVGRQYPGSPTSILRPDGEWEPLKEAATMEPMGFRFPEGALDALVQQHLKVAAPNTATERHLLDAIATRDRLLSLVEKRK